MIRNQSGTRLPIPHSSIVKLIRDVTARLRLRTPLSIVAVSLAESRRLNSRYRRKRHAANVLTFTDWNDAGSDVIICPAVIRTSARQNGMPYRDEFVRMILHGVLHVAGRHHPTDRAAERDELLINDVVRKSGVFSRGWRSSRHHQNMVY